MTHARSALFAKTQTAFCRHILWHHCLGCIPALVRPLPHGAVLGRNASGRRGKKKTRYRRDRAKFGRLSCRKRVTLIVGEISSEQRRINAKHADLQDAGVNPVPLVGLASRPITLHLARCALCGVCSDGSATGSATAWALRAMTALARPGDPNPDPSPKWCSR